MSVRRDLPALRECDNFAIECWADLSTKLGGGWAVLREKCRAVGLGKRAAVEMWWRARKVESVIQQWQADIEEARRNAVTI